MRLLDLYSKAGGAAVGYHRAGFEVVCVDIEPQPNNPFEFHQSDAITFLKKYGHQFDAIHASPPCQKFSRLASLGIARNGSYPQTYEDLILPTRDALRDLGVPYVIENVPGSPLIEPIMLCGSMFPQLRVYRHRHFECSFPIIQPDHLPHNDKTPSAGNGMSPKGFISVCGSGGVKGMNSKEILSYWSMAMGIHWMTRKELSQAIPPAFTEYIGQQLGLHLRALEVA